MIRLVDDRGRLFGKINVVDILVLLVIVALAVFVGLRVSGVGTSETVPVRISFTVQPIDKLMLDGYKTLGPVEDTFGRRLGTITSAEVLQPDPVQLTGKGLKYGLSFPVAPDVLIVVDCEGKVFGESVHVASLNARVGAKLKLFGPGWEGEGCVVDVDWGAAATE